MRFPLLFLPCEFEIPDQWWTEAGMETYSRSGPAYRPKGEAVLAPLRQVDPPVRSPMWPPDRRGLTSPFYLHPQGNCGWNRSSQLYYLSCLRRLAAIPLQRPRWIPSILCLGRSGLRVPPCGLLIAGVLPDGRNRRFLAIPECGHEWRLPKSTPDVQSDTPVFFDWVCVWADRERGPACRFGWRFSSGPFLGPGRFLRTRSFTSDNLRLSEVRMQCQRPAHGPTKSSLQCPGWAGAEVTFPPRAMHWSGGSSTPCST